MTSGSANGTGGTLPTWLVEVVVVPKEGVNDPEGEAILGGLRSLGYAAVARVQSGRFFTLTLSAPDAEAARADAARMADQLLANPVIQTFRIESITPRQTASRRT
jgi:phosphoribosylformylglycinamidine synthase PurS subunit